MSDLLEHKRRNLICDESGISKAINAHIPFQDGWVNSSSIPTLR